MTVLQYARLAAQCYSDPPTFGKPDGAGRAHIYGDVAALLGTNDLAALIADIDAVTENVPGLGSIHAGFWSAFCEISGDLMRLTPQVIVGHSLGGALALIYAGMLCRAGRPPAAVYCFEPPRLCADVTLNALLDSHGVMRWACRNGLDPITELPSWMTLPAPLSPIGQKALIPNLLDYHMMADVMTSLQASPAPILALNP